MRDGSRYKEVRRRVELRRVAAVCGAGWSMGEERGWYGRRHVVQPVSRVVREGRAALSEACAVAAD